MKQLKSLFSNISKVFLLFASFVIVIGMLAFVLGESSYGIKNKVIANMCANVANALADGLIFVLSGLLVAIYFWWEHKRKNKVSWKHVLLITILAIITSVGLYFFGPYFVLAAFILILCIMAWRYINRSTKDRKRKTTNNSL